MLLANFNRKEHLRHRAVSLRQHGFLVTVIIVDVSASTGAFVGTGGSELGGERRLDRRGCVLI